MKNLIVERKNKILKTKKLTRILSILNLLVFIIGVIGFLNSNDMMLFLSQLFIMSMLLIISIFEYNFRKLEVKLYKELKDVNKDSLTKTCLEKINTLEKDKAFIDKLSAILFSLCLIGFILSLILHFSNGVSTFNITKNISLIAFMILFLKESNHSKKLTLTIDTLIDSYYTLTNII